MNRLFKGALFIALSATLVAFRHISLSGPQKSISVPLLSVYLTKSRWTENEIIAQLEKSNSIFGQCDIRLGEITLYSVDYTPINFDLDDIRNLSNKLISEGLRVPRQLTVIFAGGMAGWLLQVSGGLGRTNGGFSTPPAGLREQTEDYKTYMENFAFITDGAAQSEYKAVRSPAYTPVAHELGHILLDSVVHESFANLMGSGYALVNGSLTPSQCEQIRSRILRDFAHKAL